MRLWRLVPTAPISRRKVDASASTFLLFPFRRDTSCRWQFCRLHSPPVAVSAYGSGSLQTGHRAGKICAIPNIFTRDVCPNRMRSAPSNRFCRNPQRRVLQSCALSPSRRLHDRPISSDAKMPETTATPARPYPRSCPILFSSMPPMAQTGIRTALVIAR